MGFFSLVPPPEDPNAEDPNAEDPGLPPWFGPSEDEIPVAVPLQLVLASEPGVVMFLNRADVHREGIAFAIGIEARFPASLSEARRTELRRITAYRMDRSAPEGALRVGLTLPDGEQVGTGSGSVADWGRRPDVPVVVLSGAGGGGSVTRWSEQYSVWLWPLPPEGRATLHYVYGDAGIPEGSVEIDLSPLVRAAADVVPLEITTE